jgi:hypothetical protein
MQLGNAETPPNFQSMGAIFTKIPQREFPSQNQSVLITFEWMEIDEKCQWTTYRKSESGIER